VIAITPRLGPNVGLEIFFAPANVPADFSFNESNEFHEALHGFSRLSDGPSHGLYGTPGLCNVLGAPGAKIITFYPDCWTATIDITYWIENYVQPH